MPEAEGGVGGGGDEEVLLLGMDQYLKGAEWVDMISSFLDRKCASFVDTPPYSVEHHDAYLEFRHMADTALDKVLVVLGVSDAAFVGVLERYVVVKEASALGPMDALVGEVMASLLSLQDFQDFAQAMRHRARANDGDGSQGGAHVEHKDSTEPCLGGYDLSAASWVEQYSTALELMGGYEARTLTAEDEVFVPWAECVVGFHAEAGRCNASGDYNSPKLPLLTARLLRERFRVDMVIAQRLARQPIALAFWTLVGGHKDKDKEEEKEALVTHGLLELQESAQTSLCKAKAKALSQGASEEEVGGLYLLVKEGRGRGGGLSAAMDGIYDHVLALTQAVGATQEEQYERLQGLCMCVVEWAEIEATVMEITHAIESQLHSKGDKDKAPHSDSTADVCSHSSSSKDKGVLQWVERLDPKSNTMYYVHSASGHSQWKAPNEPYVRWVGATPLAHASSSKGYKISLADSFQPPPTAPPPSPPPDPTPSPLALAVPLVSPVAVSGFRPPPIAIPADAQSSPLASAAANVQNRASTISAAKSLAQHVLRTSRHSTGPQHTHAAPLLALSPTAVTFLSAAITPAHAPHKQGGGGGGMVIPPPCTPLRMPKRTPASTGRS